MDISDNSFTYKGRNNILQINNPEFITSVAINVSKQIGRLLERTEKDLIINLVKNIDPERVERQSPTQIHASLVKICVGKLRKAQEAKSVLPRSKEQEFKDYLDSEIGVVGENDVATSQEAKKDVSFKSGLSVFVSSILGQSSDREIQRIFNPVARNRKAYVNLDSKYRLLNEGGTTFYKWNVVNIREQAPGAVNVIGSLRDIVALRVYPTRLPYPSDGSGDTEYKQINMLIDEFASQAVIAQEGRRYHIVFKTTVDGDWIDLNCYEQNNGRFRFVQPVTTLSTLTVSFAAATTIVPFDADRLLSFVSSYGSPTIVSTAPTPHNLRTGNRVSITGFTTYNPVVDDILIKTINSATFTVIVLSTTTFSIPISTASLYYQITGTVGVVNGSNAITGTGTTFTTDFKTGDGIAITDSGAITRRYRVAQIIDNLNLLIESNYAGITEAGLISYKDNRVYGLNFTTYFESKRLLLTMEFEYIYPDESRAL